MKKSYTIIKFIGFICGVLYLLNEILAIKVTKTSDLIGPRAVPLILLGVIICGIGVLFLKEIRIEKRFTLPQNRGAIICFMFLIAYVLMLKYVGFIFSSLLFLISSSLWLGKLDIEKKTGVVTISLFTVSVVYCIFELLFHMNLPRGMY